MFSFMARSLLLTAALLLPLQASDWVTLFNGKDLSGWTPKIAKHPLGENAFDTFRVEDGILWVWPTAGADGLLASAGAPCATSVRPACRRRSIR